MQVGELYYRSQRRQYYGNLGATDYASCIPEVRAQPQGYVFQGAPVVVSFAAIHQPAVNSETEFRQALIAAGYQNVLVSDAAGYIQSGPVTVTMRAASDRGSVEHIVREVQEMAINAGYLSISGISGSTDRKSPEEICAQWKGGPPLGSGDKINLPGALDAAKNAIKDIGWPVYVGIALLIFMFKS